MAENLRRGSKLSPRVSPVGPRGKAENDVELVEEAQASVSEDTIRNFSTNAQFCYKWPFERLTDKFTIKFSVKASSDVNIGLSTRNGDYMDMYHIVLGGTKKKDGSLAPSKGMIKRKKEVTEYSNNCDVSPDHFTIFIINWNGSKLSVYKGINRTACLVFEDPDPIPVRYLGFTTGYGSEGEWRFHFITEMNGDRGSALEESSAVQQGFDAACSETQTTSFSPVQEFAAGPTKSVAELAEATSVTRDDLVGASTNEESNNNGDTCCEMSSPDSDWEFNQDNWKHCLISLIVAVLALCLVIFLPLSFPHVEYYQFGLIRDRVSGAVNSAGAVFSMGRYARGLEDTFKKYPAWAHLEEFEIEVFTSDRITLDIVCSFQYFIKRDELGLIEDKYDRYYPEVITSVAEATLKNQAAGYSRNEYLSNRGMVEQGLHDAVRLKLGGDCCPDPDECIRLGYCHLCNAVQDVCTKGFHVDVRFFQLKKVSMPDRLKEQFLNIQIIHEESVAETYRQEYALIVKTTESQIESILNSAAEITNNATAQSGLVLRQAQTTAKVKREMAHHRGLKLLYQTLSLDEDNHKASIHWLRTIQRHSNMTLGVNYQEYKVTILNDREV